MALVSVRIPEESRELARMLALRQRRNLADAIAVVIERAWEVERARDDAALDLEPLDLEGGDR